MRWYGNAIGSNLFFVRRELLNGVIQEKSVEKCYVRAKFRQARNRDGALALLTIQEEEELLRDLPLIDVMKEDR